jgi:ribosomal 50S subunit-recycling heat shock protein
VNDQAIQPRRDALLEDGTPQAAMPIDKLIHLALPVRLIHMHNGERGMEFACTYDIHPRGARLRSSREVKVGDLITIERGRSKSVCQVVWTADRDSSLRGQFTVECVEGSRIPWEEELRQMEEQYLPVIPSGPNRTSATTAFRSGEQNRRRAPRFPVEGEVNLAELGGHSHGEGRLEEISEYGCLIHAGDLPTPGTGLRLVLNMCDVSVALRGHVRYASQNRGMGVEFQEIRQGDRPLLDYVLNQLKKTRIEDFADLEVITESLEAVAE